MGKNRTSSYQPVKSVSWEGKENDKGKILAQNVNMRKGGCELECGPWSGTEGAQRPAWPLTGHGGLCPNAKFRKRTISGDQAFHYGIYILFIKCLTCQSYIFIIIQNFIPIQNIQYLMLP